MIEELESIGLLREYRGVWQYRTRIDGPWYSANSRQGAIDPAQALLDKLPESERLTSVQRAALHEAEYDAQNEAAYGHKSMAELEEMVRKLEVRIASYQHAGKRLYSGNGHCYTAAAVSNGGARDLGEIKLRLTGYMRRRGESA